MSDQPPVTVQRLEPPTLTTPPTRELSDNDLTNRETISKLRGLAGRYAAALRNILDEATPGTTVHALARKALEGQADG